MEDIYREKDIYVYNRLIEIWIVVKFIDDWLDG